MLSYEYMFMECKLIVLTTNNKTLTVIETTHTNTVFESFTTDVKHSKGLFSIATVATVTFYDIYFLNDVGVFTKVTFYATFWCLDNIRCRNNTITLP
jgi:hypothetical protein